MIWYYGEIIEKSFWNKRQIPDLSRVKRIVILHLSAGIGNAVLFTPTLKAIKDNFPRINLTMILSQKTVKEIIENSGLVNEVVIYDIQSSWLKKIKILINLCKIKPDIIIHAFPSNWKSVLIGRIIGAKYRIGHRYKAGYLNECDFLLTYSIPFNETMHEVDLNLELAEALDTKTVNRQPFINISDGARQVCRQLFIQWKINQKFPLIGFHCGSPSFKRWPENRFADLGDRLVEQYNAQIVIVGGQEDVELAERINRLMNKKANVVAGKMSIMETASLIEKCNLFISNDSGPMHIAAAVNTPVIAIFGPTIDTKNRPYGKMHIVIKKDLPCRPCYDYSRNIKKIKKCSTYNCLNLITVQDVMKTIETYSNVLVSKNKIWQLI